MAAEPKEAVPAVEEDVGSDDDLAALFDSTDEEEAELMQEDLEQAPDQTPEEAMQEATTKATECKFLLAPRVAFGVEVNGKFGQLPVEPVTGRGQKRRILLQFVEGVPAATVDFANIAEKIANSQWMALPDAIGFRAEPIGLQSLELVVQKGPVDGELTVTKVLTFSTEAPITSSKAKAFLGADANIYQLKKPEGLHPKVFMEAFAYLLDRMGGECVVLKQTVRGPSRSGAAAGPKNRNDIEEQLKTAYAHIRAECPKKNMENAVDTWFRTEIA